MGFEPLLKPSMFASIREWRCRRCGGAIDPQNHPTSGALCRLCSRVVCRECLHWTASVRARHPICRDCAPNPGDQTPVPPAAQRLDAKGPAGWLFAGLWVFAMVLGWLVLWLTG